MISKLSARYLMSVTGIALSAVLVAGAGGSAPARAARPCNDSVATAVPQPTSTQMKVSGLGKLRVAPWAGVWTWSLHPSPTRRA